MEKIKSLLENFKTLEFENPNDSDLGSLIRQEIRSIQIDHILEEVSEAVNDQKDKYLRLVAEFDNYKKRVSRERDEVRLNAKVSTLQSILDLDSDLNLASVNEKSEGLKLIMSKFTKFLDDQGIKPIQTETYDSDLHEVISIIPSDQEKIVSVISKGYTIDEKPFRYPKIILGRPNE